MTQQKPKTKRIGTGATVMLTVFAITADLMGAFLEWIAVGFVVNWVIDPCVGAILFFCFWLLKVNFKGTRAVVFFGLGFLELVPVIKEFPLWTLDVIAVVLLTNAEDMLGKKGKDIVNSQQGQNIKRSIIKVSQKLQLHKKIAEIQKQHAKIGGNGQNKSK